MIGWSNTDNSFIVQSARKVIFGNGAINQIGGELVELFGGGKKILIITDKGVVQAGLLMEAVASLKNHGCEIVVFDDVVPDPPISIVLKCVELARYTESEIILGIGGGSCIDAAKAVSVMVPHEGDIRNLLGINQVKKPGLPKVFVPTTAGTGSEMGLAFVLTDEQSGDKITSYSPYTLSDLSIIDPALTLTMPPDVTAESGMDAFAHALEAFVGARANPFSDILARRAIELISANIRDACVRGDQNINVRYAMCLGSYLAIMAVRQTGLGLIHSTCYPPAAKYHLRHGYALCLMMPAVMKYNLVANSEKFAAVASVMGENVEGLSSKGATLASVKTVRKLIADIGMRARLRDTGVVKKDFPQFAEVIMKRYTHHFANNPGDVSKEKLIGIYKSAW